MIKFLGHFRFILILLLTVILLQACEGEDIFRPDYSAAPPPLNSAEAISDTTLPKGVQIYVIEEGNGPFEVVYKDVIRVKYTGRTEAGDIFVSSYREVFEPEYINSLQNLYPYAIETQTPQGLRPVPPLIEGFRKGLLGMREGEVRIIRVPSELVSRTRSNTGVDLEDKTLIYNVELISILGT